MVPQLPQLAALATQTAARGGRVVREDRGLTLHRTGYVLLASDFADGRQLLMLIGRPIPPAVLAGILEAIEGADG
jgi:hypothetical protein